MTYQQACQILGFTSFKGYAVNARLAQSKLQNLVDNAPIKYRVACQVLIDAAK